MGIMTVAFRLFPLHSGDQTISREQVQNAVGTPITDSGNHVIGHITEVDSSGLAWAEIDESKIESTGVNCPGVYAFIPGRPNGPKTVLDSLDG